MRIGMRWLAVAAAVTAAATVVQAQPPGGGRGGFGGRGGGFGFGGMGGPVMLVANPAVLDDLKATDEQKEKLREWAREYREKTRGRFQELQGLSPEEIQAKMAEWNADVYKEVGQVLKEDQVKRIRQIELQSQGFMAFARPEIQNDLKLSDDQKDKIREIGEDARQDMMDLFQSGGGFGQQQDPEAREAMQKKMAALREESLQKVNKVLTDDQKAAWKNLTGEPFNTGKLMQPPGGGRGGFGGPPGGGRGGQGGGGGRRGGQGNNNIN